MTTSISGSEYGKAGNCIYWDDVTDDELNAMQDNYWKLLTKKFDALCRGKGSTGCLMLDLSEVYYEVGDDTNIDFYEVLVESRQYAFEKVIDKTKDKN